MAFKSNTNMIFMMFFGAIIATVLIGPIADSIFPTANSITYVNQSFTVGANGTSTAIDGRDLVGVGVIFNATGTLINSDNVTVEDAILNTTGLKSVIVTVNNDTFADQTLNFSYTFNPDGFIGNSGGRAIISLVILFAALGTVVFVIVTLWRNESFQKLLGK